MVFGKLLFGTRLRSVIDTVYWAVKKEVSGEHHSDQIGPGARQRIVKKKNYRG